MSVDEFDALVDKASALTEKVSGDDVNHTDYNLMDRTQIFQFLLDHLVAIKCDSKEK